MIKIIIKIWFKMMKSFYIILKMFQILFYSRNVCDPLVQMSPGIDMWIILANI